MINYNWVAPDGPRVEAAVGPAEATAQINAKVRDIMVDMIESIQEFPQLRYKIEDDHVCFPDTVLGLKIKWRYDPAVEQIHIRSEDARIAVFISNTFPHGWASVLQKLRDKLRSDGGPYIEERLHTEAARLDKKFDMLAQLISELTPAHLRVPRTGALEEWIAAQIVMLKTGELLAPGSEATAAIATHFTSLPQ